MQSSTRKTLYAIAAWVALAGMIYMAYHIYQRQSDWTSIYQQFKESLSQSSWIYLIFVLALMPLNWVLESKKWQLLLSPICHISVRRALVSVLHGIAASLMTPQRVGDYLGRLAILKASQRWQGLSAQALGSTMQLVLVAMAGWYALYRLQGSLPDFPVSLSMLAMCTGILLISLVILLRIPSIMTWVKGFLDQKWIERVYMQLQYIRAYQTRTLVLVALITVARFAIYLGQYVLLLQFFGIATALHDAVAMVALVYFLQAFLPLPVPLGLVARGEITLLVWKIYAVNELAILSSSYLLWLINVMAPAVVGVVLLIRHGLLSIDKKRIFRSSLSSAESTLDGIDPTRGDR